MRGATGSGTAAVLSALAGCDADAAPGKGNESGGRLSRTLGTGAAMPDDSFVTCPVSSRKASSATKAMATVVAAVTTAARV